MKIRMESEQQTTSHDQKSKQKRSRPTGPAAPSPSKAAKQAKDALFGGRQDWEERLANDPSCFAEVEREVHELMRGHADIFVAGLLAKVSEQPVMQQHIDAALDQAAGDLRAVEKKVGR